MIVVSDTSPIVNLATVGQLGLLNSVFANVIIPQAVYDEIVVQGAGQPGAEEVRSFSWIESRQPQDQALVTVLGRELDRGEAEAIALALELRADLLLIDERRGRDCLHSRNPGSAHRPCGILGERGALCAGS